MSRKSHVCFRLMASGDAHVALSHVYGDTDRRTYEVVIGGAGNSMCAIRYGGRGDIKVCGGVVCWGVVCWGVVCWGWFVRGWSAGGGLLGVICWEVVCWRVLCWGVVFWWKVCWGVVCGKDLLEKTDR